MKLVPDLEIEWDTDKDVRSDGTKRPYSSKASTIHGWVTKMRGTLVGNERTRSKGIREMKAAKAIRQYKRQRAKDRRARGQSSQGGLFAFLGLGSKKRGAKAKPASRSASTRAVVQRGSSTRKGNELVLHVSSRTKSPRRSQSTRVEGRITHSRATSPRGSSSHSRPAPQRRATVAAERSGSSRRPSQHTRRHTTDESRSHRRR
ncbi:hypothetical protein PsYK624_003400 [Phanerochaete sordida]|uniref:Uncharacterized protein n=1 Tax=Phanerochaete sordida TaxID=48140 RepID=A0A9P3L793_9APHY|nr:hypothetical protein PsYK624_003400 [Phanerochaete sordida]